jgi:hypothetical protein
MLIQIVLAGALIAFFILAGVTTYWQAIIALPASAAAFLGALSGAGGGLLAIIIGALINAELNRRRDDRLCREEARSLALSLHGETLSVADSYRRHKSLLVETLNIFHSKDGLQSFPVLTRLACSAVIFSKCCERLGLLEDPELIRDLAHFYASVPKNDETISIQQERVVEACQGLMTLSDEFAERAESLANQLESAASRLAAPS